MEKHDAAAIITRIQLPIPSRLRMRLQRKVCLE